MEGSDSTIAARGALALALRQSGLSDVDVLRAIETAPRELFAPQRLRALAARNCPLPIACGQTMEAPVALAAMLDGLALHSKHRALEIGAGSGYATATLARLTRDVVSYERFHTLAAQARDHLAQLGLKNAVVHCGDGLANPKQFGPYDRILVNACLPSPSTPLCAALKPDGLLLCALPAPTGEAEVLTLLDARGVILRQFGPIHLGKILFGVARAL